MARVIRAALRGITLNQERKWKMKTFILKATSVVSHQVEIEAENLYEAELIAYELDDLDFDEDTTTFDFDKHVNQIEEKVTD